MSEIIPAEKLAVGDVFIDHKASGWVREGLRVVEKVRQVRYAETYTVIEYANLANGTRGQLSLFCDLKVTRVEEMTSAAAYVALAYLQPGESTTFWKRDGGGFYA